ncbi:MAG: hypothetical protein AAB152_18640 [Candidatus Coatesbacteria bacterium]
MKVARLLRLWVAAAAVAWAAQSRAATADGTLITNLASFTYRLNSGMMVTLSYGATATVMVARPAVLLQRVLTPTIQSAGGTLTFRITMSNASSYASAFAVTATETMPGNVKFAGGAETYALDPPGGTITPAWSTNAGANWTSGSYPATGQAGPLQLRWSADILGPKATGVMTYTVSIL